MIVCKVRFSLLLLLLQWQWLVARVHSRKECKTICAQRCFLAMLLVKSTVYDLNWLTTSVVHCMWEWLTAHTSFLTFPFPLTAGLMGHHRWLHNQFTPFSSVNSTALWDLVNSRPVHFLMLSSHLFLCLPCLLPPFTVHCKMVLARPDEWETCPYHFSLCLFTMVRRSCRPAAWCPDISQLKKLFLGC